MSNQHNINFMINNFIQQMHQEPQLKTQTHNNSNLLTPKGYHQDDSNQHNEALKQSNVSHVSDPQNLIHFFRKQYKILGTCLDLHQLNKSDRLRLKKYKEAVYYGDMINSKRHGNGIMVYDNGRIYQGKWENDFKHGEGFQKFPNQCVYQGDYINGKPEGVGRYSWPNGEFYEGQWMNGLKHGSGLWKGAKGDSYAGQWKFGRADGYGVHEWINGDRYEGEFKECLKHGQGIEKFANGDIYKGNYMNGKPNGFGQYYWKNGSYFKGNFRNGLRDGQGLWKRGVGNTDKYEGQYKNDKKSGYGIFCWATGNIYKGNYEGDLRNGYGQMYWSDNSYYKGNWKDGVQNGDGQIYVVGEGYKKGVFENNELVILEKQLQRPENQKYFQREETSQQNQKSMGTRSRATNKSNMPSKVAFRSRGKSVHNSTVKKYPQTISNDEEKVSRYSRQYNSFKNPPSATVNLNHPLLPKRLNRQIKYATIDREHLKPKTAKKQRILHSSFYMHKIGQKNRANTTGNGFRDSFTKLEMETINQQKKGDMLQQMKLFARSKISKGRDVKEWH